MAQIRREKHHKFERGDQVWLLREQVLGEDYAHLQAYQPRIPDARKVLAVFGDKLLVSSAYDNDPEVFLLPYTDVHASPEAAVAAERIRLLGCADAADWKARRFQDGVQELARRFPATVTAIEAEEAQRKKEGEERARRNHEAIYGTGTKAAL